MTTERLRTLARARCATCGTPVDPLRAPAIRMTTDGVLVYCSVLHRESPAPPPPLPTPLPPSAQPDADLAADPDLDAAELEPPASAVDQPSPQLVAEVPPRTPAPTVERPDANRPSLRHLAPPLIWLGLLAVVLSAAGLAWSRGRSVAAELGLAGVIALFAASSPRIARGLGKARDEQGQRLRARLGKRVRRVREQEIKWVSVRALRPGEGFIVEAGEHVPCDGVVLEGHGTVQPYADGAALLTVEPGVRLSAGARLEGGTMHVVCTAAGADRTFDALLSGLRSQETFLVRTTRGVRLRAAPLAAVGSFVVGVWLSGSWLTGILVMVANAAALLSPLPERLVVLLQDVWLYLLAEQGVDFGPGALDAAGHVQVGVFCARGTFLAGEPEVTDVVVLSDSSEQAILALAAGAESVAAHPAAASIRRAAHDRHVSSEPTRGHDVLGGMGVTCYSADGHRVVVGTRELMMKEKVSIALAEDALRKMEQRGRSGILVAKAGRLIGILALHDALRKGARASVQLLLDVHVEPVLLSGEARTSTEALGRALSIEHVRPEVPARERAAEVRRVIEGGAAVAVVGHSPLDDSALSAASVPIVLDGSALTPRARGVTVLGDDVLTAAHALVAAQVTRRDGVVTTVLCLAPAWLGVLCTSSLLFPPVVAPLAAMLGCVAAAVWVWSRLDRARRFRESLPRSLEA
jgi:P-type Cu+ transporter